MIVRGADAANAARLVAQVPAALRGDPGLAFEEARWWRKKDNYDNAANLLLAHADNPVKPPAWWDERLMVARRLLATGKSDIAERLVQQPLTGDGSLYAEAEFLSGYIALRLESTVEELMTMIHAHPTLAEAVLEAALDVKGEGIHKPRS